MQLYAALTTALLAATSLAQAAPERITFLSGNTSITGYRYTPSGSTPAPVVLIAHGLGGLQTSRLPPFAERFRDAGYNAITFDYRYWGQSAGTPRNIIDITSQQDDYRAAITAARKLPGVDGRVIIWGTSLSGGHVLVLGSQDPSLKAVIAQAPHTNGLATVGALPPASLPGLIGAGLDDASRPTLGKEPLYIPIANETGQFGALTQEGALDGYKFVQPNPPAPGNVFPARFVLQLPFFSPDAVAAGSKVPTFIGVGSTDNVTPNAPAKALAERMGATLKEYEGGHFSVYPGASQYENIVRDQIEFLKAAVPL